MPIYADTVNNVNYTYNVGTPTAVASMISQSSPIIDITILSKFTVNNNEYIVTSIGGNGFLTSNLKSVTFQSDTAITSIGVGAFMNTPNLASIIIPASVTSIGLQAFYNDRGTSTLTSVTFENTVEKPSKLETIGGGAFMNTKITSISIPKSVKTIEASCFNTCDKLLSFTFEENSQITVINSNVFTNCFLLPSIVLPNSVTSIGYQSFYSCSKLSSVTFPVNPLFKTILIEAFRFCGSLTTIVIPETVTDLGLLCFGNCDLSSITIPKSITKIGDSVFYLNTKVKSIIINSPVYTNVLLLGCSLAPVESVTYNAAGVIPDNAFNTLGIKNVTFGPDSAITSIGVSAFMNTPNLASIIIPASVTNIGSQAFYNTQGTSTLTSVTFENTVEKPCKLETIGNQAFQNTRITSLTIPKSVKTIGDSCFHTCDKLTSFTYEENSQITVINSNVFTNCFLLPSIVLPNSVTSIGYQSFYSCSKLSSVTFPVNPLFKTIDIEAFRSCGSLTTIVIPETVTKLGNMCFSSCDLSSITIPKSVTTFGTNLLGTNVFSLNTKVKSIIINSPVYTNVLLLGCSLAPVESVTYNAAGVIPDNAFNTLGIKNVTFGPDSAITSIGVSAFMNTPNLASIIIPASVTNIGSQAFYNTQGTSTLTSVTFENTVEKPCELETIGNMAFARTKITSLTIPKSVKTIGDSCFHTCDKLTSFTYEENSQITVINSSVFTNCFLLPSIVLPNSVTSIGYQSFYSCSKLSSVTFPVNPLFKTILVEAFRFCGSLTTIVIPETVTDLGNLCFGNCDLSSITIPKSITKIGDSVFSLNTKVKSIIINSPVYTNVLLLGCSLAPVESVTYNAAGVIPDNAFNTLGIKNVTFGPDSEITSIGVGAFMNTPNLASIIIPASVTSIGLQAFYNDRGTSTLTSVTFENTVEKPSKLETIGNMAFARTKITSLTIPKSVKTIGDSCFHTCDKLTSFTYEENSQITVINSSVFTNCFLLPSIVLPNSVTSIGYQSFYSCSKLSSVTFPVNPLFKTILVEAFRFCGSLTTIVIPETVTDLGLLCFGNCDLSSITIPKSITKIGDSVFSLNTKVKSIIINSPVYTNVLLLGCSLAPVESVTYNAAGVIPDNAFNTLGIKNVTFGPDSAITSIGSSAFMNTPNLASIIIPASVTSIGGQAFYNNQGTSTLTTVTFENTVEKPCKLETIGASAFVNTKITSISIPKSVKTVLNLNGCNKLVTVTFEEPSQVNDVWFNGCSALTSISIPKLVTYIGFTAFAGCSSLESITFHPESAITGFGDIAFTGCSSLKSISIPNTVTNIGSQAFRDCTNLNSITIPRSVITFGFAPFWNVGSNLQTLIINSTKCLELYPLRFGNLSKLINITFNAPGTIPNSNCANLPNLSSVTLGPDITAIGDSAFSVLPKLFSITIPASVTSIGANAFLNSTNLVNVSFERNSKLITIGGGAFKNCALTSIEIPGSVSRIYNDTFAMSSLKKVFFSDQIPQSIDAYNFINPLYTIYVRVDTPRQDTLATSFKNVIEIPQLLMDFATSVVPPNIDFAAPDIPNVLSVVGANNKITVNFTQENSSPVPVVNYAYSIDNGVTFIPFNPKQKLSPITISGLINGQRYSVSIKAYNGYYSDATTLVSGVLVNYPQPAPIIDAQTTIASGENEKTKLYFSQSTNNANAISNYWLSINGGEFSEINLSQVLPSETQTKKYIQLSGLTNGQTYSFTLKSNNSLTSEPMFSEPAIVNNVFINYPQPAAVINTETTFGENSKAYISFTQETNSSKNIISYFYSTNGTTWTDLGPMNKTSPLVISNLTNGQNYSFTIKAYNGLSSDPIYSHVSNTAADVFINYPQLAPIIDTQATINSGNYGEAKLYFSQPTNNGNAISSYWLSINGGTFKDLGSSNKTSPIIISNLVNGLTYSFAIKSSNGLKTEPIYSNTSTVTGVVINYPQLAPRITSTIGLNGKATINFTQDINTNFKNVTNYLVSIDDGVTYNELNPASILNTIVINNLQNGNTYKVSLKSFNGLTSDPSTTENIFIDYPQPAPLITSAQGRNNTATIYFDQTTNTSNPIKSYLLSINGGAFTDLGLTNKKNPLRITNLINGSTYSFSIKAFNGLESDASNTISNILIMVSQPPPTFTTTFGENGVAYINFTQQINPLVPTVSNYLYSTDGINYVDLAPTNKTSPLKINNLTNSQYYSFTFKSYNGIDSDPSPPNDIFINYPQLAPVINTVTTYGENNKAYINFTQPTNNSNNVISYFYSTDGINWTDVGPFSISGPLIISNLTNGEYYSFRIKGYNGLTTEPMYSPVSNIVTIFINYPKPAPVINTVTTFGENNNAYIYFTQPTNNSNTIDSYFYSTDGNIWSDLGPVNKTSPLVISDLTNGQSYSFTIKAYNGLTSDPFYSVNSNTVTDVFINYPQPAPVINNQLTIDSGENGKAKLYFSQPVNNTSAISSYLLSINGGIFIEIMLSQVLSTQVQDTKYIQLSGLTNGQTYSFTLKSFNGLTTEPLYSNTATVNNVFINYPQPAPVINTTTTFGENTKAYINFTQPTNNAKSVVSYSYSTDGTNWIDLGATNKTSPLVISNLVDGQTYSFTIKAYNGLTTDPMYSVNSNRVTGVFINYPQLAPKILPPLKTINGAVTVYWSQTKKNSAKNITQYYYSNGVDKKYYPIDKLTNPLTLPPQPANTKLDITIKGFNGLTTEPKFSSESNMCSITQTVVQGSLTVPNNKAV
jgi:hypothetical protein